MNSKTDNSELPDDQLEAASGGIGSGTVFGPGCILRPPKDELPPVYHPGEPTIGGPVIEPPVYVQPISAVGGAKI